MPPEEEDADTAGPATSFLRMPDSTSTAAPPTSAPTPSAQADAASAAGAAGAAAGLSSHDDMPAWLKSFLPKPEPPLRPVMKPDIVFFGQDLPEVFYDSLPRDTQTCDLVIVIGSSLKVCSLWHLKQVCGCTARVSSPPFSLRAGESGRADSNHGSSIRSSNTDQSRAASAP